MRESVLESAQRKASINLTEWAARGGTSRTRLSAYKNGRTSPRLDTVARLLACLDFELTLAPEVRREVYRTRDGRDVPVLTAFSRLGRRQAFARVDVPVAHQTRGQRRFDLYDEVDRKRFYAIVLNNSLLDLAEANIDPMLLDLVWPDLELVPHCKEAWRPALDRSLR